MVQQWEIKEAKERWRLSNLKAFQLTTLRFQLQQNPQDASLQSQLQHVEHLIANIELQATCLSQEYMHTNWLQGGEHCSCLFFQAFKTRSGVNRILAIRDEDGILHTSPNIIQETIIDFFHKVLASTSSIGFADFMTAKQWVLDQISNSLIPQVKSKLEASISTFEKYEVMKAMPTRKTP